MQLLWFGSIYFKIPGKTLNMLKLQFKFQTRLYTTFTDVRWSSIGSPALSFNYSYGKDVGFNTGMRAAPHCGVMYNSNA